MVHLIVYELNEFRTFLSKICLPMVVIVVIQNNMELAKVKDRSTICVSIRPAFHSGIIKVFSKLSSSSNIISRIYLTVMTIKGELFKVNLSVLFPQKVCYLVFMS